MASVPSAPVFDPAFPLEPPAPASSPPASLAEIDEMLALFRKMDKCEAVLETKVARALIKLAKLRGVRYGKKLRAFVSDAASALENARITVSGCPATYPRHLSVGRMCYTVWLHFTKEERKPGNEKNFCGQRERAYKVLPQKDIAFLCKNGVRLDAIEYM
jgi:hypothetical protein